LLRWIGAFREISKFLPPDEQLGGVYGEFTAEGNDVCVPTVLFNARQVLPFFDFTIHHEGRYCGALRFITRNPSEVIELGNFLTIVFRLLGLGRINFVKTTTTQINDNHYASDY
jgi:hypothetical protein